MGWWFWGAGTWWLWWDVREGIGVLIKVVWLFSLNTVLVWIWDSVNGVLGEEV